MRTLAALSLAAALSAGSMTSASAFVHPWIETGRTTAHEVEVNIDTTPVDHCHGRSAGTAHRSCGTRTGGPAGGLF